MFFWSAAVLLLVFAGRQVHADTSGSVHGLQDGQGYRHPLKAPLEQLRIERVCLTLTQSPGSSQAVTWRTADTYGDAVVEYVRTEKFHDKKAVREKVRAISSSEVVLVDGKSVFYHSAVLKGLAADQWYSYRVGHGSVWSEWCRFRTASGTFRPFSFLYFGDIQNRIAMMCAQVFRAAFFQVPDARFALIAGDFVNDGTRDDQWNEFFDAMGWLPKYYPLLPVAGNHEYPDPRIVPKEKRFLTRLWQPQFHLPDNGPTGLEESCYWLEYQDVLMVVLNGNEKLTEQAAWLSSLLEKNRSRRKIVSMHQPVYSTSTRRNITVYQELFVPVFDRFGVDLVLQGHDHAYSRTYPLKNHKKAGPGEKGTVYIMSIAGPKAYEVDPRYSSLFAKTASGKQWFQEVKIKSNAIVVKTFDLAGNTEDRVIISSD